jgi:hypothetical protein
MIIFEKIAMLYGLGCLIGGLFFYISSLSLFITDEHEDFYCTESLLLCMFVWPYMLGKGLVTLMKRV